MSAGNTHALLHEIDEGGTGCSFGQDGQEDEARPVVGEPVSGWEVLWVPVEHLQIVVAVGQLMHRHRQVDDVA